MHFNLLPFFDISASSSTLSTESVRFMGNVLSKMLTVVACVAMIAVSIFVPCLGPIFAGALMGAGVGGLTTLAMGGSVGDAWKSIGVGFICGGVGSAVGVWVQGAFDGLNIGALGAKMLEGAVRSVATHAASCLLTGRDFFDAKSLGMVIVGSAAGVAMQELVTGPMLKSLMDAFPAVSTAVEKLIGPVLTRLGGAVTDQIVNGIFNVEGGWDAKAFLIGIAIDAGVGSLQLLKHHQELARTKAEAQASDAEDAEKLQSGGKKKGPIRSGIDDDENIIVVEPPDENDLRLRNLVNDGALPPNIMDAIDEYFAQQGMPKNVKIIGDSSTLLHPDAKQRFIDSLAKHGIDPNRIRMIAVDDSLAPGQAMSSRDGTVRSISAHGNANGGGRSGPQNGSVASGGSNGKGGAFCGRLRRGYCNMHLPKASALRQRRRARGHGNAPSNAAAAALSKVIVAGVISGFASDAHRKEFASRLASGVLIAETSQDQRDGTTQLAIVVDALKLPLEWKQSGPGEASLKLLVEAPVLPFLSEKRDATKTKTTMQHPLMVNTKDICTVMDACPKSNEPWAVIAVVGSSAHQAAAIRSITGRLGYTYSRMWFSQMVPSGCWAFLCPRHNIMLLQPDMRQQRAVAYAVSIASEVLVPFESEIVDNYMFMLMHAMPIVAADTECPFLKQCAVVRASAAAAGKRPTATVTFARMDRNAAPLKDNTVTYMERMIGADLVSFGGLLDDFYPTTAHVFTMKSNPFENLEKSAATTEDDDKHTAEHLPAKNSTGKLLNSFQTMFTAVDNEVEKRLKADMDRISKAASDHVNERIKKAMRNVERAAENDENLAEALTSWTEDFAAKCQAAEDVAMIAYAFITLIPLLHRHSRSDIAMEVLAAAYDMQGFQVEKDPSGWNSAWENASRGPEIQCVIRHVLQHADVATKRSAWEALGYFARDTEASCRWWLAWRSLYEDSLIGLALEHLASVKPENEILETAHLRMPTRSTNFASADDVEGDDEGVVIANPTNLLHNQVSHFLCCVSSRHEGGVRITSFLLQAEGRQRHGSPSMYDLARAFAPKSVALHQQGVDLSTHSMYTAPLTSREQHDVIHCGVLACWATADDVRCPKPFDIVHRMESTGFAIGEFVAAFETPGGGLSKRLPLLEAFCSSAVRRIVALARLTHAEEDDLSTSHFFACEPHGIMDPAVFNATAYIPIEQLRRLVSQSRGPLMTVAGDVVNCVVQQNDESRLGQTVILLNSILLMIGVATEVKDSQLPLNESELSRAVSFAYLNASAAMGIVRSTEYFHRHLHAAFRRIFALVAHLPPPMIESDVVARDEQYPGLHRAMCGFSVMISSALMDSHPAAQCEECAGLIAAGVMRAAGAEEFKQSQYPDVSDVIPISIVGSISVIERSTAETRFYERLCRDWAKLFLHQAAFAPPRDWANRGFSWLLQRKTEMG